MHRNETYRLGLKGVVRQDYLLKLSKMEAGGASG